MRYEVREVIIWSNKEPHSSSYGIYIDDCFPDDLDYVSLKELAIVINQFIKKKEAEK